MSPSLKAARYGGRNPSVTYEGPPSTSYRMKRPYGRSGLGVSLVIFWVHGRWSAISRPEPSAIRTFSCKAALKSGPGPKFIRITSAFQTARGLRVIGTGPIYLPK